MVSTPTTATTTPTTTTATTTPTTATTTTSRLSVRGPPLDPEGQGDSRKLARAWVQKDKVICATEPGKDKGTHYYDYDYRDHYSYYGHPT